MRVCPKCHYREPPIWRNRFHRLYEQYCRIDELADYYPDLARKLIQEKYVFHDGIKYKLNEDDIVCRLDAFLCANSNPFSSSITEPNKEKHKARLIKQKQNQLRLEEVSQP